MTQREWKRRRDAQRLLNYHNARMAEQSGPIRAPDTVSTGPGHIIAIDEAKELSVEDMANFADEMFKHHERNLTPPLSSMVDGGIIRMGVDYAGNVQGRPIPALEIRDRPIRRGLYFGNPQRDNTAPPMNLGPIYFNRWMDMTDSEDELQRFLWACYRYGETSRTDGEMSVKDLEDDTNE